MRAPRVVHLLACCLLVTSLAACREDGGIEVKRFTFHGTDAVSDSQLRSVLATGASSRIPWGTKRYFNREQFEADLKRIVAFYRDRGFPDARVTDFDVELSRDQESVRIAITIDEGEPIVAERIVFEGFEVLPEDQLAAIERALPLQQGGPLDRALLQASRETALDVFRDHGYPYAAVRLAEGPGGSERHRVITLRAEPGQRAVHGPIEIVGNTSVDEGVIRRQLTFRPGMEYRLGRLQESQRRLYSQELFQFANIEPQRDEGQPAEIPTRVTVVEGKHRRLNFGVGYGTEERARTEIDWRHVNFFGGARTAGVRARYSSLDRGVRLNLTEPYFFSPRYSLGLTGQSWHTSEPLYRLNSNGARATVTRQFMRGGRGALRSRPRMSLSLGYGVEFEEYEIDNDALEGEVYLRLRDDLIALGMDPRTGFARGTRSFISLDGGRNTTDSMLDAKRGYLATIHLEQAGKWLGGDFDYYEVTAEGRYYQNLADLAVLAVQARAGSISGIGGQEGNVPFHKRYLLGGSGNLRGWGRFQVSPLSGFGLPIGGATFLNSSVELRMPVWRDLSGVLFVDAGNVWEDPWSFDLADMRYNVGPGLRYNTPIGPIRADIGYQLNPIPGLLVRGEPEKRRFRFHFSIGQAF
jgi:outer membrane protein assembly complex protein YaeT